MQASMFGSNDPRLLLEKGKTYEVVDVDTHDCYTQYMLKVGDKTLVFNSGCFGEWEEKKLPKKLKALIVDEKNVFLVRILTDPETTRTGIANIIPAGISREERDYAISICHKLVDSWNENQEWDG